MSQTVSEMFGYERESDDDTIIDNYDDDTIIDNYDDSSSDISMPSDVTVDSDSDSHSESENDTDNNNNNRQHWPVPVLGNNVFTNELSPIVIQPFTDNAGVTHNLDDTASVMEFFNLLFTDDMLENIVVQTNLYAQQSITVKPDPAWYDTSREEMRAFLGINIYMGIVVQPEQHMYWE